MAHTTVPAVSVDDFGKASWANLVRAADVDLTTRVEDLETVGSDVVGPGSSVASEIALYDGTSGALLKRATGTGYVKVTSGVMGTPAATVPLATDVSGVLPYANLPVFTEKRWYQAALTEATLVDYEGPGWSYSGSPNDPGFSGVSGTNNTFATADFADGSDIKYFYNHLLLPSDWTGAIDARIVWRTSATSGNVVWQIQTAFTTIGDSVDPAWNTASTVTQAAQGTTNRQNMASMTGITITGAAASKMMWFRILRDPTHGSDTLGAAANLIGVELTWRRQLA